MDASPSFLLPLLVPTLLVSGGRDTDVPPNVVTNFYKQTQMRDYNSTASSVKLLHIEEADHYNLVDASDRAWEKIWQTVIADFPM